MGANWTRAYLTNFNEALHNLEINLQEERLKTSHN